MFKLNQHGFLYTFAFFLYIVTSQPYEQMSLYRSEGGEYYTIISVGSPPQLQTVIIDNTETLLLLNCNDCLGCKQNQTFPQYKVQSSFSSKRVECRDRLNICSKECNNRKQNYPCSPKIKDNFGIYDIAIISDQIQIKHQEEKSSFRMNFGCIRTNIAYQFVNYENGILGLANSQMNIFGKLLETQDKKPFKQLGFCFAQHSGYLQVGSIPNSGQSGKTFKMHSNNYFALAQARNMSYGNISLTLDTYIQDSGLSIMTRQPYTIFPSQPFDTVKKQISSICSKNLCKIIYINQSKYEHNLTCLHFERKEIKPDTLFPNFQLIIANESLIWEPRHYMKKYQNSNSSQQNIYCLQFRNSSKIKNYVLGLSFLQGKRVVFDILANSIHLKQNQSCELANNIQVKVFQLQYLAFCVIMLFLCFRSNLVRLIAKSKIALFHKQELDHKKAEQIDQNSTASIK